MTLLEALGKLKESGIKATPQRQEILRALLEEGHYCSADEILKKVQARYPAVSFDTVYRNLSVLTKLDLVVELRFQGGPRLFEFNDEHHHHLVCLKCKESQKLVYCPTDFLNRAQEENPEFAITSHSFKIYGYCPNCRK